MGAEGADLLILFLFGSRQDTAAEPFSLRFP